MLICRADLVVSEMIDGEAMIMHNGTGHYFCANGSAAALWEAVRDGTTIEALTAITGVLCHLDNASAGGEATSFVELLCRHDLVVTLSNAQARPREALPVRPDAAFARPTLEIFTDLADMLLLDPIHDVDETGWPAQPSAGR